MFLAIAVDAAHALFEADRVPGDVVVDHEPAELQVDALARGLCGDKHLRLLAELTFGINARAGRVAVATLHAAVDLGDRQTPLAQLAQWAPLTPVARQVV